MKIIIAVITVLTLVTPNLEAKKTRIKFATVAPEGSTWINMMKEYDRVVQERTGGEIKFKIYAGARRGDEKDVIRKISLGQLHAGGFSGFGLGMVNPEARVMDLPFLFRSYEEVDYVLEKIYADLESSFEKSGYVLLGWAEVGFIYIFSTKPIREIEDIKKSKMWVWEGDKLVEVTFKEFGVSPIPLPLQEVFPSLQTGLIDSYYNSPLAAIQLQWSTKTKYMTQVPLADASGALLISKKVFDKLSPEHQVILKSEGQRHMRKLVEITRGDNVEAIKALQKRGIEVVEFAEKDRKGFEGKGVIVREKLAGELFSKEILDKVLGALKEYRKKKK